MTRAHTFPFKSFLYFERLEARDLPSFTFLAGYQVELPPIAAVVDHVNRDGALDVALVIGDSTEGQVLVFLGRGDGSLEDPKSFPIGKSPADLVGVDLNSDGRLDLVATTAGGVVNVLLGNGNGLFKPKMDFPGGGPRLVAADFDQDGNPDIATTRFNPPAVNILYGNGDGTLQPPAVYRSERGPIDLAAGDLNADGFPDLAVALAGPDAMVVILNRGDGTFLPPVRYQTGMDPTIAMADVDNDNCLDVVISNSSDDSISILLGKGDGTLHPKTDYPTHEIPDAPVVADFDQDGDFDIATLSYANVGVAVLLGKGDGTFFPKLEFPLNIHTFQTGMSAGDLNGDQFPELVVPGENSQNLVVLLNDGIWAPPIPVPPPHRSLALIPMLPQPIVRIAALVRYELEVIDDAHFFRPSSFEISSTPLRRAPAVTVSESEILRLQALGDFLV